MPVAPSAPATPRPPDDPVVVFLPAHDEAQTVAAVVKAIPATVDRRRVIAVVVDDGSADGTAAAAAAAGAVVIAHPDNRGLGAAVRTGLAWGAAASAAAVVFCDADGEYDPAELTRLVRPILRGEADYVVGSRFAGGRRDMRPHREVGNRALTVAVRWLVRHHLDRRTDRLTDGQSGFRALSGRAAADAEVIHDYNYAQVLTLDLLAKGFRYSEVPIRYRSRRHGRSFVRLVPYLRHVVPAIRRELRSPASAAASAQSSTTNERKPSVAAAQVA